MAEMTPWEGGVEGLLPGARQEILIELLACVDVARDGGIRLTKSGMPPKPLWSQVNERLLWSDPRSILYDWDEVDQVRFVYSLAEALKLIEPDEERSLRVGPGADAFYLATPLRRTQLLLRAYRFVVDWDERCDARNEQGNRFFFGQTFRRDFRVAVPDLREILLDHLGRAQVSTWYHVETLALAITEREPGLLISSEDPLPETTPGESDGEIRRLIDYWLLLVARFGLVDLARTPDHPDGSLGERLFRLTPLGARALLGPSVAWSDEASSDPPFVLQPNNDIVFYRELGDVGDEYVLRRITSELDATDYDEKTVTYPVTPQSLRAALEDGLDAQTVRERLFARSSTGVPSTFETLLADAERLLPSARIVRGLSALELPAGDSRSLDRVRALGFEVFDRIALIPWDRWPELIEVLGEIEHGYEYPPLEDLIVMENGRVELAFQAVPLAARDLIEAIGLDADTDAPLDAATIQRLGAAGWPREAVRDGLLALVESDDSLPRNLRG